MFEKSLIKTNMNGNTILRCIVLYKVNKNHVRLDILSKLIMSSFFLFREQEQWLREKENKILKEGLKKGIR